MQTGNSRILNVALFLILTAFINGTAAGIEEDTARNLSENLTISQPQALERFACFRSPRDSMGSETDLRRPFVLSQNFLPLPFLSTNDSIDQDPLSGPPRSGSDLLPSWRAVSL